MKEKRVILAKEPLYIFKNIVEIINIKRESKGNYLIIYVWIVIIFITCVLFVGVLRRQYFLYNCCCNYQQ